MSTVPALRIFIASPSDTGAERAAIKTLVRRMAGLPTNRGSIHIEALGYEDMTPRFDESGAQAVIDSLIDNGAYDLVICVFKHKFGRLTDANNSATAHEIEKFTSKWQANGQPRISIYRDNSPVSPSELDADQFAALDKYFSTNAEKRGLFQFFKGIGDFTEKVEHLLDEEIAKKKADLTVSAKSIELFERNSTVPVIRDDFQDALDTIGNPQFRKLVSNRGLRDVYVFPDLFVMNEKVVRRAVDAETEILEFGAKLLGSTNYLVTGKDGSGKTAFSKILMLSLLPSAVTPIYAPASSFGEKYPSSQNLTKILNTCLANQYNGNHNINTIQKLVVIIDDFHELYGGKSARFDAFIDTLNDLRIGIIAISLDSVCSISSFLTGPIGEFTHYSLAGFSHAKLYRVIEAWTPVQPVGMKNDVLKNLDKVYNSLLSALKYRVVPTRPFFVITFIRLLFSGGKATDQTSFHAFYYEFLITDTLRDNLDHEEVTRYLTYCTDLFSRMYLIDKAEVDKSAFLEFHQAFKLKFNTKLKSSDALKVLSDSNILAEEGDVYRASSKYIYYYFVARGLVRSLSSTELDEKIQSLLHELHNDDRSSLLLFIIHLSTNASVIRFVNEHADSLFSEALPIELDSDIKRINSAAPKLLKLDVERFEAVTARVKAADDQPVFEHEFEGSEEGEVESVDVTINEITNSFRTLELQDQILSRFWGALDAVQRSELIYSIRGLGQRVIGNAIIPLNDKLAEVVMHVAQVIYKAEDRSATRDEVQIGVSRFIFHISTLVSHGVIDRVSKALSVPDILPSVNDLLSASKISIDRLILLSVYLRTDSLSNARVQTILDNLIKDSKDNPLVTRIIRALVTEHICKFDVHYKAINKYAALLSFDIKKMTSSAALAKDPRRAR